MTGLPNSIPVIIVGAGPTGLTLANLLGKYEIETLVIERNKTTSDLPRAVVLDDEGQRTMHAAGLTGEIEAISFRAEGMRYYLEDGSCFATVGAGQEPYGFPRRVYFHQPDLEKLLLKETGRFASVSVQFETELTSFWQENETVFCRVRNPDGSDQVIECAWLLACDGGRSPVRGALEIPMRGETYRQDWIVLDLNEDDDQDCFSKFYCDPARPWVSIPAPYGGRRYEFMLLDGEDGDQMLELETLQRLLAPVRTLSADQITRKTIYTFHARVAEQLQVGRVLLLGDAAHMTPPFAGQGMNAGIRDTWNVAWKIAAVLQSGASPDILQSYETERREPIWAMIRLAVAMGEVIMPIGPSQATLRNAMVEGLTKFPEARDYFLEMKFKPKPVYTDGLFLDLNAEDRLEATLVGQMIPQPRVRSSDGQDHRLDDLLGFGFAMIAQDEAGDNALSAMADLPDVSRVSFHQPETASDDGVQRCTSLEPDFFRPLRTHRDQIMIVRPDRYVLAAVAPSELAATWERIKNLFGQTGD